MVNKKAAIALPNLLRGKKAQEGGVGMSFGLIFSIILIIFFAFAAVWGIKYFLNFSKCAQVGLFYDELQRKVDNAYQSSSSDFEFLIDLPGIDRVCFANLSESVTGVLEDYEEISQYEYYEANTFLIPPGKACDIPYKKINHINITEIIRAQNPYCIPAGQSLRIKKNFYDRNVVIK